MRFLERVVLFLVGLALLTPLVVLPDHFLYPFVMTKVLFFRITVELLLGVWCILWLRQPGRYRVAWTPITLLVVALLGAAGVSAVLGVDPFRSFWDSQERMMGWFTLLHYGLYCLAAATLVKTRRSWRVLTIAFLTVGSLVMALGIVQIAVPGFLHGTGRAGSTLGQPIHFAGFALFLLFLSLLSGFEGGGVFGRTLYAVSGSLAIVGVVLSQTRGALVALGAGVFVGLVCWIVGTRSRRVRWGLGGVLALWCLGGASLLLLRGSPILEGIPSLERLSDISLSTQSARTRTMAWALSLEAFQDHPLLGWGPCNFAYAFNLYYRPEFLDFGWQETWWDHPHSVPFNQLVTQGGIGLLVWLGLLLAPVAWGWRRWRCGKASLSVFVLGTAFTAAYFVHHMFAFEGATSYLSLMFFLALWNHRLGGDFDGSVGQASRPRPWPAIGGAAVGVVALVVAITWWGNVTPGRASFLGAEAVRRVAARRPEEALGLLDRCEALPSPHLDSARVMFGSTTLQQMMPYVRAERAASARALLLRANEALKKNLERAPADVRSLILRAGIAQQLWARWQVRGPVEELAELLETGLMHSPRRQELLFAVSANKLDNGKTDEAIDFLRRSIDNASLNGEGWWRLAVLYDGLGRVEDARKLLREAKERGVLFVGPARERVERILR